ncbi:MarR family winged helix-turn-helix transcriptional regulator [Streptomyces sp. NPDC012474]|uniref:MarR family winged helix-turn-helix transcriptional regulator n=1 Tax=Streptomyces sp. NPDC012474 TaxID=3364836 RepID=UPI0036E165EE
MADLKLVFQDLVRFQIELWNAVDARLRTECDLQLTWFEVMRLLAQRSECRVQDMAAEFGITVGGTSKVVDRIEAAGYCRRRANPQDRRSSLVELTPTGRHLVDRALTVFEVELERWIGSVVPEQDLEKFAATLSVLRAAGRSASAPR